MVPRFDRKTASYVKRRLFVAKTRTGIGCVDCSMKMLTQEVPQPEYGHNEKNFLEV